MNILLNTLGDPIWQIGGGSSSEEYGFSIS